MLLPDGTIVTSDHKTLNEFPNSLTWDEYLAKMGDEAEMKRPNQLDPFGFSPENFGSETLPFTAEDAIQEIRSLTGRDPSDQEVNDWLFEMNEPFSNDSQQLDEGLPGYTEEYTSDGSGLSAIGSSYNILFLLLAAGLAGLAYRWTRKSEIDDEFVKADDSKSLFNKFKNPFSRYR